MQHSPRLPAVALALALLGGCPDRSVSELEPAQRTAETKTLPAMPNRDVDILFVIDNSGSMAEEQASLRANVGKFMDVLATIEGGLPNVHIGVVTSNLGQRASDGVGTASFGTACGGSGDDGVLRGAPQINGRFIVDEATPTGARNRNYSGSLVEAFAAIADVGVNGCGIEQHLAATQRAFENPLNAGFLRKGAKLAVIFIADEDDCSLAHTSLFAGSTEGPVINFRCTEDAFDCEGGDDLSVPGPRTGCVPRAGSPYLNDVDRYADFLRGLKGDPDDDIFIAGIVGDPEPFEIVRDPQGRAVLGVSCTYAGQVAYPAVRTADLLSQFRHSARETICDGDLSRALVEIGVLIRDGLLDSCFKSVLADLDPAPGLQPDCAVSDYRRLPDGSRIELGVIPACGDGALPCWRIETDETLCFHTPTKLELVIDRGGVVPSSDVFVAASCVTTDDTGPVQ